MFTCYLTTTLLIIYLLSKSLGLFTTLFGIMFILTLIYQIKIFHKDNHLSVKLLSAIIILGFLCFYQFIHLIHGLKN